MSFIPNGSSSSMASFGDLIYLNKAYLLDKERSGIVRWIGQTEFKPGIEWIGFELIKGVGKNDGTVKGISYFKCDHGRGVFVRIRAIIDKVSDENYQKLVGMKKLRSRRDIRTIPNEFSGSSKRTSLENKQQLRRSDFKWNAFPDRDSAYGSLKSEEMTAYITDSGQTTPYILSQSLPTLAATPESFPMRTSDGIEIFELDDRPSTEEEVEEEKTPKRTPIGIEKCMSKSLPSLDIEKKAQLRKLKIPRNSEKTATIWKKRGSQSPARDFFQNLEQQSLKSVESLPAVIDVNKLKYKWEVKNRRYLWPTNGGGVSAMDVNYELKVPPSAPKGKKETTQYSSEELDNATMKTSEKNMITIKPVSSRQKKRTIQNSFAHRSKTLNDEHGVVEEPSRRETDL